LAKNRWIAAFLNLLFYGLGYLYLGERKALGAMLFVARIVFVIAEVYALAAPISSGVVIMTYVNINTIGFTVLGLALAYDAYRLAKSPLLAPPPEIVNHA
jgi:hypothetical protein